MDVDLFFNGAPTYANDVGSDPSGQLMFLFADEMSNDQYRCVTHATN